MEKRKTDARRCTGRESCTLYLPLQTKCCVNSYSTALTADDPSTPPPLPFFPSTCSSPRLCCGGHNSWVTLGTAYSALCPGDSYALQAKRSPRLSTANRREEAGRKCVCEAGSSTLSTEGTYINRDGGMDELDTMNPTNPRMGVFQHES